MSDLIRRGVVPWKLRQAVIDSFGHQGDELTDADMQARQQQKMIVAAEFVRAVLDDESEEWEFDSVHLTVDSLTDYPGEDIEAIDTFVTFASTEYPPDEAARLVNQASEVELFGLKHVIRTEPREAVATVSGWSEFRDKRAGGVGQPDGADVAPTPVKPNRATRRAAGVRGRRSPRAADGPREAAG